MNVLNKIKKTAEYGLKELDGKITSRTLKNIPHLWMISERGDDARDNGYHFFRYLIAKHPEIHPVYLIDPRSFDYPRVSKLGTTVIPGSRAHYAIMEAAEALISTHDCGFTPDMVAYHHYYKNGLLIPKGKRILLQHGIMNVDAKWYYREECIPDMFVVSTEEEKRVIQSFGQPDKVIALTGMPRYDALSDAKAENMILVMPTWRQYLVNETIQSFQESEYFRFYNRMLHSERLHDILESHNMKLVFYPHIEMQRWNVFHSDDPLKRVGCFGTDDVQALLKQASLLVTDYSSVYFDEAYMGRDIVFAQFDRERWSKEHYSGIVFDMNRFGYVTQELKETEDAIEYALNYPGEKKKEQYDFFKYHDTNNCDRVFEEIRKRIGTF